MKKISVLVTSDIHGYVMPTDFSSKVEMPLGLGKLATIIEEERKKGPTLLIENGDFIQGSPMTYYEQKINKSNLNQMILVANEMKYDAAVFGNHEFNYGLDVVEKVVKQSNYPWLAANIKRVDNKYFTQPYLIKEINGVRIGIVGGTTQRVPIWEEEEHIKDLKFEDAFECVEKAVNELHSSYEVDIVIIAYHGGFENDLISGKLLDESKENLGYKICSEIEGVHVVLTGHQHREIAQMLFNKAVVQPGAKGKCLGKVDLRFDKENHLIEAVPSLIYIDETIEVNEKLKNVIAPIYEETEKWLDQVIGKIEGDMLIDNTFEARLKGHAYVEFINRVQMEVSNTAISCTSIFSNECRGFQSNVTMRDIVTNYIYPNTLKVLEIKGKDILNALEQCATYFELTDGLPTISETFLYPKEEPYNYDLWSGIDYKIDMKLPKGSRVIEVKHKGESLQLDKTYKVVMNSYRATGAGNFNFFRDCPVLKDIQTDMTELLADYFKKNKVVKAKQMENMKIVY